MHDNLKRFTQEGTFKSDKDVVKTKDNMSRILEDIMRSESHVPMLDINVQWSMDYNSKHDLYTFKITMYGVYVDGDVENIVGFSDGRVIVCK